MMIAADSANVFAVWCCSNAIYEHFLPHATRVEADLNGQAQIGERETRVLGATRRAHAGLVTVSIFAASICQRAVGNSIGKSSEQIPVTFALATLVVGMLLEVQAGCDTLGWRCLSMLVGLICMLLLSAVCEILAKNT